MKSRAGISSVIAVAVLLLTCSARTTAQQGSSALIEKISGSVFLRRDPSAKQSRLDPKSDVARRLYPGEQVRCEERGFLRLRVAGRVREIYGPSAWFTIPRASSAQTDPLRKALDEYGRRGGRDRGGNVPTVVLFSPSDRSVVMAHAFTIRWAPLKPRCDASFAIRDADSKELWRQERAPGRAGVLISAAARRALRKHRRQQGEDPLTLTLNSCGDETQSTFSLLSPTDEQSLKREIVQWNREPGSLTRHLGRAAVFTRYSMFPEAAEEYERALTKAPQSRELLQRAIVAQRRIGNSAREEELGKRLPAGTELP